MDSKNNLIVGLGEVLWDVLPEGRKLGGAPANFAYNVRQFGFDSLAISAVGNDKLGDETLAALKNKGLDFIMPQVPYPTGTVLVSLDDEGIPAYDIRENVAWDNIPFTPEMKAAAQNCRAVCWGSLAQRNVVSRTTINRFLDAMPDGGGRLKVFDINLRQKFYTKEVIMESLRRCNVLKINDEELVVIGYGTVKKKDLTGAISAVKGDDLSNRRTTMLSSALQGALSGVMVRRSSSAPGSGAGSIHVRGVTTMGDSSPLVIVDGVEGDLDYVNAKDVENVTVLKDAAAASIYGSKAAAGVILVTTKRGSDTGKFQIKYNAEFGWEIPTKQPEMVGVTRYLEMNNELQYNENPAGGFFQVYTADQTKNWMKYHETDPNHYPVTDWTDLILKSSAPRMTHTISLSGGNKYIRSQTSLSYDDVDGLYDGRKFQRYMLRSNNDFTINKWLSASLDLFVRHAKSQNKIYDPFSTMRQMPAIYAAVWDDGRLAEGKSGSNPYGLLKEGGSTVSHSTQVGGKGSLTIKPFEGLSIQAIVSPYINYQKSKQFKMACGYTLADDPNTFGGYFDGGSGQYATNKLTEGRNDDWHVTSQVIANYMRDFGKHSLTVMAEPHATSMCSPIILTSTSARRNIWKTTVRVLNTPLLHGSAACSTLMQTATSSRPTSATTVRPVSPRSTAGVRSPRSPQAGLSPKNRL